MMGTCKIFYAQVLSSRNSAVTFAVNWDYSIKWKQQFKQATPVQTHLTNSVEDFTNQTL